MRTDERILPHGYDGRVITCDVDQTYLDTDFKSFKGLASIPLEWAEDKQTITGMAPVLRALRHGPHEKDGQVPFFFLTASPPFLVPVLRRKMLLDHVHSDGIICKDWKEILLFRRRPSWLKRQLAYKLCALLQAKKTIGMHASEILIGDDTETDAEAYSTYARILAGDLKPETLSLHLLQMNCTDEEIAEVGEAASELWKTGSTGRREEEVCFSEETGKVSAIYIYLARKTPEREQTSALRTMESSVTLPPSTKLCAFRSAFQLALLLFAEKLVPPWAVRHAEEQLKERGLLSQDLKKQEVEEVRSIYPDTLPEEQW